MENSQLLNSLILLPTDELTNYHAQLVEQLNSPQIQVPTNVDTPKLMPFNGYYALNTTGAFFAIDTNMVIRPAQAPHYDLSLLVSLDGLTSTRFAFTGTFDGTHLIQQWPTVNGVSGLSINLTLTRTNSVYGTTATLIGNIALPGKSSVSITGSTYNNPIPASLFIGDYWFIPHKGAQAIKVMSIGNNNELLYDKGTNNGNLVTVPTYVYNLNMYYFSFMQDAATTVKLIMGTASAQGFACNNMSVNGSTLVSRSLITLPGGITLKPKAYDLSGINLADFSGYYQIPNSKSPLAFISIQSQYATLYEPWNLELNFVMISYSLDGVTSTGFFFDPFASMTFNNNVLTIPASGSQPAISLTFTRQYNPATGSLVNIAGTIGTENVAGSTLFNPVPLSAFGGVTMSNPSGTEKLKINNDNSITYTQNNGKPQTINNIIYVPLMYIVAAPANANPTIVLSLGTDGLRGLACIVITNPLTTSVTSSVFAINGPE